MLRLFFMGCPAIVLFRAGWVPEEGDAYLPTPGRRADCTARGGTLVETGTSPWRCILDTPDAGQACTRSTDCTAACLAPDAGGGVCGQAFGCVDLLDETGQRVTFCIG